MEKKRKARRILFSLLGVFAVFLLAFFVFFAQMGRELQRMEFSELNLSQIADGSYMGEQEIGPVYVKVQVMVKDGVLTEINLLEHRNGLGKPAESIVGKMLGAQTTNVDAVSGATVSSKVIRKAVENALTIKQAG